MYRIICPLHSEWMYAQWKSITHYNEMRSNPEAPFLKQAMEIASFEPGMYEVVETFANG